jgi:hypothetical protein
MAYWVYMVITINALMIEWLRRSTVKIPADFGARHSCGIRGIEFD